MKRAAGADEWRDREEVERHASRRPKSAPALPALVGPDQAQAAAVLRELAQSLRDDRAGDPTTPA